MQLLRSMLALLLMMECYADITNNGKCTGKDHIVVNDMRWWWMLNGTPWQKDFGKFPPSDDKNCAFQGYSPAGGVRDIENIEAPIAKLEQNTLLAIIGRRGQGISSAAAVALDKAKDLENVMKHLAKLGTACSCFSVVFGVIGALNHPTPQDIMNSVNKALSQLTDDVNKKFESMRRYVDTKILDALKILAGREYTGHLQFWKLCLEKATFSEVNACQRHALHRTEADFHKFAVYHRELSTGTISRQQVREIEYHLVVFRNYAQLVFMQLLPLLQTYADIRHDGVPEMSYYNLYVRKTKHWSAWFSWYARRAFAEIISMHSVQDCQRTITCQPGKEELEWDDGNWLNAKIHYANRHTCDCTFNDMTNDRCVFKNEVWVQHGYPWITPPQKKLFYPTRGIKQWSSRDAAVHYNRQVLLRWNIIYKNRIVSIAQKYWKTELLDLLPTWKEIGDTVDMPRYNGSCTKDYRFAYARGTKCCDNNKETNGSPISILSTSCKGTSITCTSPPCAVLPTGFIRIGDAGNRNRCRYADYSFTGSVHLGTGMNSQFKCQDLCRVDASCCAAELELVGNKNCYGYPDTGMEIISDDSANYDVACYVREGFRPRFKPGDGVGGTKMDEGQTDTPEQCRQRCLAIKKKHASRKINGVTYGRRTGGEAKRCFCRTGLNSVDENTSGTWVSAFI